MRSNTLSYIAFCIAALCCHCSTLSEESANSFVVAAVEDDGMLAVLDAKSLSEVGTVDLTSLSAGKLTLYRGHNVQASEDGSMFWATAMPSTAPHDHGYMTSVAKTPYAMPLNDELIGVDATSLRLLSRIEIGQNLGLAHVVVHEGRAFATATAADAVFEVDLKQESIVRRYSLPPHTAPHGLRFLPDWSRVLVAGMGRGSLELLEVGTDKSESFSLPAPTVQVAVTPDGQFAFASLYASRQIARLALNPPRLELFDLPQESAGPIQIYPSPDSRHLWIADQGMLGGQAAGRHLYRFNTQSGLVELVADTAAGPHGVVVGSDGNQVYTTTVVDGLVQSFDAETGILRRSTYVGKNPNGITWFASGRAAP